MPSKPVKIFVTGTRGIPNVPGGVEKHCQELYPELVQLGYDIKLSRRTPYVHDDLRVWRGVGLKDIYAPRKKSIEAIIHTFLSVIQARLWGADVLHIHAVGPALLVPFARLLGLRVVFTNHGPDYDRQKWGGLAKASLKLGEWLGGRFANEVIVISSVIESIVSERCRRSSHLIYNGVRLPELKKDTDYISKLGLESGKYILAVARFVPEKALHELVEAFEALGNTEYKLVLAGDSDHEDDYSRVLKAKARANPNVVLTGYITGKELDQVFTHAGLFALPSYHEGLPIALLEALSYGLPSIVSNIPANLEVALATKHYFECGNIEALKRGIATLLEEPVVEGDRAARRSLVKEKYDWRNIAKQTAAVYDKCLKRKINQ